MGRERRRGPAPSAPRRIALAPASARHRHSFPANARLPGRFRKPTRIRPRSRSAPAIATHLRPPARPARPVRHPPLLRLVRPSLSCLLCPFHSLHPPSSPSLILKERRWKIIYPAYVCARQSQTGARRLPRDHCLWWPTSSDLVHAALALGYTVLHEPAKTHPADWDNPGRIRLSPHPSSSNPSPMPASKYTILKRLAQTIRNQRPDQAVLPSQLPPPTPPAPSSSSSAPKTEKRQVGHRGYTARARAPKAVPRVLPPHSPATLTGLWIDSVRAAQEKERQAELERQKEKERQKQQLASAAPRAAAGQNPARQRRRIIRS